MSSRSSKSPVPGVGLSPAARGADPFGWTVAFLSIWSAGALVLFALLWLFGSIQALRAELPPVPDPSVVATSPLVVDRNGLLLRPFTIGDGRWRLPAAEADVDPLFFKTLFAYEDRRFADHGGVDWLALLRAAGQFAFAGEIVSGGSTLTMQVARLIDGIDTRTVAGKLRQIAFARQIEAELSKSEIIELYLMLAPYGGNLEGIRAAALAYFGKEPRRLTPAEAALLVALPQSRP